MSLWIRVIRIIAIHEFLQNIAKYRINDIKRESSIAELSFIEILSKKNLEN